MVFVAKRLTGSMVPPGAPPAGPSPPLPPPAPPYPYGWPYTSYGAASPKRTDPLVLAIIALGIVAIVLGAIAFVSLFALLPIGLSPERVTVTFSGVALVNGNVTFSVAFVSSEVSIFSFWTNLAASEARGSPVPLTPQSGDPAYLFVGTHAYWVRWYGAQGDGRLNAYDRIEVGGDGVPLDPGTTFTFQLLWAQDLSILASVSWTMP